MLRKDYIRIGGDIIAIIAGLITIGATGEVSALAVADLALASIDLSLMDEDLKKWLSQSSAGKWFVENWDLIYALVGAGIMSVVVMEGILTHGPTLLENLKNLKNGKGNYRIFTEQLEKLIVELEAYQARNAANVIEEVTLVGEKNGLLKKLLGLISSPSENLQFIVEDIAKLDGGEEFLRQWDLIYNVVGGAVALPQAGVALSQIVVSFYRGCLSLMKLPQTTEKMKRPSPV